MIENASEQFKVAENIKQQFSPFYEVLSNVDREEHFIGSMFPDIILLDKSTRSPLFIIEIKRNGQIGPCLNQWKSQQSIPATLYIVVPKKDLESAKLVAATTGINARFGSYAINENGDISDVEFK